MDRAARALRIVESFSSQRDVESLQRCFVEAMAAHAGAASVLLFRCAHEGAHDEMETVAVRRAAGVSCTTPAAGERLPIAQALGGAVLAPPYAPLRAPAAPSTLVLPVCSGTELLGALCLRGMPCASERERMLADVVRIYGNYLRILDESERDKLTGLLNRRTFDVKLDRLLAEQRARQGERVQAVDSEERRLAPRAGDAWLVVADVDHFKKINDSFGHVYGDEVLLLISREMRRSFRSTDLLFRFGGEEFVIVLAPERDAQVSPTVERFREGIAGADFPRVGRITASLGYARMHVDEYPQTVLDRADKALYYAKQHGRNRSASYEGLLARGELEEIRSETSIDLF